MPVFIFAREKPRSRLFMVSSHRALVLSAAALFAVVSAQALTPNFF